VRGYSNVRDVLDWDWRRGVSADGEEADAGVAVPVDEDIQMATSATLELCDSGV
jgi:hypothetical protein